MVGLPSHPELAIDTTRACGSCGIEHVSAPSLLSQLWRQALTPSSPPKHTIPVFNRHDLRLGLGLAMALLGFYFGPGCGGRAERSCKSGSGNLVASRRSEPQLTRCA